MRRALALKLKISTSVPVMTISASRRCLALWFPELPLDRWRRRDDPRLWGPFVVTQRTGNADKIVCANPSARLAEVYPGTTLTDAQALCPNLMSEPQDELREARLLSALHIWADRFSPRVAIEPPDSLLLDISGCAHLFEGERQMAELIHREASTLKLSPRIGIASTRRAARGFARQGDTDITIGDPERETAQIDTLTIAALELEAKTSEDLRRLGITTIKDLRRFKSSDLARRFSVRLPTALEELWGHRADPIVPDAAPPTFAARMTLPEPIARLEDVLIILKRLAARVCERLDQRGYAARGFELTFRCVDTGEHHRSIGFATPSRDVQPILRQFRRPLETVKLEFGADQFRLVALNTEVFRHTQLKAGDAIEAQKDTVDQTLTTLGNRLGFDRLRRPCSGFGHTPERESLFEPVVDHRPRRQPSLSPDTLRHMSQELTLYPRPETIFRPEFIRMEQPGAPPARFTWRGKTYDLVNAKGRERISPVPWDEPQSRFEAQTRDYWRAKTICGRLFWLMTFAQPDARDWFICGEFLREPRLTLQTLPSSDTAEHA